MKKLVYESYLAHIINSVWSPSYRQFFVEENGEKRDVMDHGDKSCAYFVSSVLKLFDYSETYHATVQATIEDMVRSGWRRIGPEWEIPPWSVIVWTENIQSRGHRHIGFYVWENTAISNSSRYGKIRKHTKDFGGKRNISAIYTRDFREHN